MRSICLIITTAIVLVSGCAKLTSKLGVAEYQTIVQPGRHDEAKARKKHEHALKLMGHGNYRAAEQMLRDALLADVSFGPAHNSLGKLYFDQHQYYLAAWEFEYAQRLMPGRGEPVSNLGLVYESTGQLEKAISFYQQASNLAPNNAYYLGNLVRARIRSGDDPLLLRDQIERLIFIDDRQEWVDWRDPYSSWGKDLMILRSLATRYCRTKK